jgi:hypothetical protein
MFGWITPKGEFVEVDMYEHIIVIARHKEAPVKVQIMVSDLDACEAESLALIERGEHPEWHCYEMMQDRLKPDMYRLLLNEGFIRVGKKDDRIHFEGRPNILKKQMQRCKDFAENYDCTAEFEPQR